MSTLNPFLIPYTQRQFPHHSFPFHQLEPNTMVQKLQEGFEYHKRESHKRLEEFLSTAAELSSTELLSRLEWVLEPFDEFGGLFNVIYSTMANDDIRQLAQKIFPEMSKFRNQIFSHPRLYQIFEKATGENLNLSPTDLRMFSEILQTFKDHGAHLDETKRHKLLELETELESLSLQFNDNVVAATEQVVWLGPVSTPWLKELPPEILNQARKIAQDKGHPDQVAFTLHLPFYINIMKYCSNREVRRQFWMAYNSRALTGPKSNVEIIKKILIKRTELAQLLGYSTYADLILKDRMAQNPTTVWNFLNELRQNYQPAAHKDLEKLQNLASQEGVDELKPWDVAFYQEKLLKKELNIEEEKLKAYFSLPETLKGIQQLALRLFGFELQQNPRIPTYHPDVMTFEVWDVDDNQLAGLLYLDLFARNGKSQGAWMDDFQQRGPWTHGYRPAAVLIAANFTPSVGGQVPLLSLQEVTTLFHEMGHAFHALASRVTRRFLGGTRVKWDFVELPSQLLENWVFEPEFAGSWAKHWQTQEPIPKSLLEAVKRYQQFQAGYAGLRQVSFAILDMSYHHQAWEKPESFDPIQWESHVIGNLWPWGSINGGNQSTHFTHIFAGGYAAGYYSYKWAEVLEANAWEVFQQEGILNPDTGRRFKNVILAQGNSKDPNELFREFAQKEPSLKALLIKEGVITAT